MDKKVTYNAVNLLPVPSSASQRIRALDILISKNGVFRTNERWVYDAVDGLIKHGYIRVDANVIVIGDNFESLLIDGAVQDPAYTSLLVNYRSMIASMASKYDILDSEIMNEIDSFISTDEKILYLASIVADISGKVDSIIDRLNKLDALCAEIDLSLSVVESISSDENSNS